MLLAFEGLSRPIALIGCDDLTEPIAAVLRGWRFAEAAPSRTAPVITVERTAKGYRLDSPWLKKPLHHRDRVDAVCSFLVDLIRAYIADDPTLLCLHCAAAEFAGRLVIFPSHYRAGKSTLAAYLAAAGIRLFADDVLPIRESGNEGVAPGILPRLRLPLPKGSSAAFRAFVRARAGLGNKRYLYLDLDAEALPPLGTAAPIGGFVLLRRKEGVRAVLAPIGKSEMLRRVILRNFAYEVAAVDIVGRLHGLVVEGQCFVLSYADGEDAVRVLGDAFARWPSPAEPASEVAAAAAAVGAGDIRGGAGGPRYLRNPGIVETTVEHDLFLVNPEGQAIFQLNAVGAALWQLLAEPIAVEQVVGILHQAFPDVARQQVRNDVSALIDALVARGLASRAPGYALSARKGHWPGF